MAKIQIVARINFDVVVRLDGPVSSGAQLKGQFQPGRLGGGGANTGVALCHAGHDVSLFADVGNDAAGDSMLTQLVRFGADVSRVRRLRRRHRRSWSCSIRPASGRSSADLRRYPSAPKLPGADEPADALYIKTYGPEVADLMRARLDRCLVVSHAPPAGTSDWPAHVLVNSAAHMTESELADPLAYGRDLAGEALRWMVVTDGARGATAYGCWRAGPCSSRSGRCGGQHGCWGRVHRWADPRPAWRRLDPWMRLGLERFGPRPR